MDQKLKDTLVKYGKQVMKPLIEADSEKATFTPGSSGISSTTINGAIKESYSKAKDAASTAASAYTAANNAATTASSAYDAANAAGTKAQNAYNTANNAYNAANDAANTAANAASAAISAVFAKIYLDPNDSTNKTLIIDLD